MEALNSLLIQEIGKRDFKKDVKLMEKIDEYGVFREKIKGAVILVNTSGDKDTKTLGGTSLSDIEKIEPFSFFLKSGNGIRFAMISKAYDTDEEFLRVVSFRRMTVGDRRQLRNEIKFFSNDTFCVQIEDFFQDGGFLHTTEPFIQRRGIKTGNPECDTDIVFLRYSNVYGKKMRKDMNQVLFGWGTCLQTIFEKITDYAGCYLVRHQIGQISYYIPVSRKTPAKAFRSRENFGKRRDPIIHEVSEHTRNNSAVVQHHARGTCEFVMDGRDYTILMDGGALLRCFLNHKNGVKQIQEASRGD